MTQIATLNDLYPGKLPAGTEVELLSASGISAFIRVGKRTIKVSPKWLDIPAPEPFQARGLHWKRSVVG